MHHACSCRSATIDRLVLDAMRGSSVSANKCDTTLILQDLTPGSQSTNSSCVFQKVPHSDTPRVQLAPGATAGLQCVLSSSYSGIQREQGVRGNVTRVGDRSVPSSPSNRMQLLCCLPNGNVQKVIKKIYGLGHPMSHMHYHRRGAWYQHVSQVPHDATSQN